MSDRRYHGSTHIRRAIPLLVLGILLLLTAPSAAQQAPRGAERRADRVRVFLDCQVPCFDDHLRREIGFVDYVRDRQDADAHVLVTRERAGTAGWAYRIEFLGRGRFAALDEELRYVAGETDTDAEVRDGLTQTIRLGLLRYVVRTADAADVRVEYRPDPREGPPEEPRDDPWNRWIFRTGLSGNLGGEESTRFLSISGNQSASHVSEVWKAGLTLQGSYSKSEFEISDTETVESTRSRYKAEWLLVRSIGDHWGFGFRGAATSSSFDNYDLFFRIAPAIEYNVFPYSESSTREFRFLYSAGLDALNYEERTVFGQLEETLYDQTLSVTLSITEPWGTALGGVEASHYLDDFDKNRVTGYGFLEVRLVRGLSLFVGGDVSRIRDQINLPAEGPSDEEILLRERVLSTPFSYSMEAGLSFTFGSIYSSVVNTRFGS